MAKGALQAAFDRSLRDPAGFWGEAGEAVSWYKKWAKVLDDSRQPFYRWFVGGELNTCYNTLDLHVEKGRGDQAALIYDSPVTNSIKVFTYRELRDTVATFAGAPLVPLGAVTTGAFVASNIPRDEFNDPQGYSFDGAFAWFNQALYWADQDSDPVTSARFSGNPASLDTITFMAPGQTPTFEGTPPGVFFSTPIFGFITTSPPHVVTGQYASGSLGQLPPFQIVIPDSVTCGPSAGQQDAVTRGSTVICSVNGLPSGVTVSNWQFTDGTNTVTGPSSGSSWSGTAVQGGTVSVANTQNGTQTRLSTPLTVKPRTGWAFTAVSPLQVSPQTLVCTGSTITLTSPPNSTSKEGHSCLDQRSTFNSQTISGGPNSGYTYITSATNTTSYQWEIVPDLANTSSQFYLAQCGNYNAQSNPTGFISGANLAAGTQRHEGGTTASHWAEYKAAQDSTANNVGLVYEGVVAAPGAKIQDAVNSSSISTKQSNIKSAFSDEPFPINDDQNGNFLGNINFQPYQSCQ